MADDFDISDLANGYSFEYKGIELLAARRPFPIPAYSPYFVKYILKVPRRLQDLSYLLYQDVGYWALLAEWNNIPSPAIYLTKYLPRGFEVRYMDIETYKALLETRVYPNLNGAGQVTLGVEDFSESLGGLPLARNTEFEALAAELVDSEEYRHLKVHIIEE